jgi:hypothetical protein
VNSETTTARARTAMRFTTDSREAKILRHYTNLLSFARGSI